MPDNSCVCLLVQHHCPSLGPLLGAETFFLGVHSKGHRSVVSQCFIAEAAAEQGRVMHGDSAQYINK